MSALAAAKQLLADAVGLEDSAIPGDARIGAFERWDSLAHMRLLIAVEKRLGHELEPDDIARIESLADIEALLQNARIG
jgi:acyl carrier protein